MTLDPLFGGTVANWLCKTVPASARPVWMAGYTFVRADALESAHTLS